MWFGTRRRRELQFGRLRSVVKSRKLKMSTFRPHKTSTSLKLKEKRLKKAVDMILVSIVFVYQMY